MNHETEVLYTYTWTVPYHGWELVQKHVEEDNLEKMLNLTQVQEILARIMTK